MAVVIVEAVVVIIVVFITLYGRVRNAFPPKHKETSVIYTFLLPLCISFVITER